MKPSDRNHLLNYYHTLCAAYGPQHWWPGETPFEVIVGAILTQNTNWKNVEKGIEGLRKAGWIDPHRLAEVEPETLHPLLRPVGYFRIKTERLLAFVRFLQTDYDLDLRKLDDVETDHLREAFLRVNGIGPETADSILLYALNRPVFVVDAYTRRVLIRHRLIEDTASYDDIQALFMNTLPRDVYIYNEYHALLVRVGKEQCRTKPRCGGCPLESLLGEGDPV